MTDVCLIPARIGSTRFPGKPLAEISGVPMVLRVMEKGSAVFGIESTYVVTDDSVIEEVVRNAGYLAIRVDDEVSTGTDRIAIAATRTRGATRFFNLQGDEPLVSVEELKAFRDESTSGPFEVTNAYIRNLDPARMQSPNAIKMVMTQEDLLLYASRSAIPFEPKDQNHSVSRLQVCMYSFTENALNWFLECERGPIESAENIEILRFVEHGIPVKMIETFEPSHPVDVPSDIETVERILAGLETK
jgi:3-deoxy-manno-octulosonate cytidylyltransferase (CMP-KDO synthetase)